LVDDERQPIFESVCRARHWLRQAPYDDFDKNSGIQRVPFIDQQLSLHVGRNNNIQVVLSMTPTTRERAEVHCIDQESPVGSVLRPRSAGQILALILLDEPITMRCSAVRRGHGEGRDGGKRGELQSGR
jgi:hypothetical protein